MRTCQSCGKENPPDRDFCDCGEYLRWDPTGFVDAVTPEMAAAAAAEAAPPAPDQPAAAAPPPPPAGAATPQPQAPPPPAPAPVATGPAKTQVHAAAPPPQQQVAAEPEHEPATITLRLPDDDAVKGETLAVGVHPGDRARVRALIRNQSGIVDNYQLSVSGLPDDWFSVLPDTVYLVPYGSGGTYEQEVEIHFHPPRSAEAEARIWELQVIAHSKAHETTAATAPLLLGIQPFEEHDTKVKPERASGRRKADFDVAISNKANAPVFVAFTAKEADDACGFEFEPASAEIAPGDTIKTRLRVRPPKQIWIGRPTERRLEVQTKTGEEAAAIDAAAQNGDLEEPGEQGGGMRGKLRGKRMPGVSGPRVYKPQVSKPNVFLGPGGVQVQKPMVRGPQVVGPQARGMNLNMNNLKMPGGQAPPKVTGPLLPTQAVFRQKPWLPWWVAIVIPLLALLALLLFLFLPKNVTVPDVVGKKSAFEAEKLITEAGLKLAPTTKEKANGKVPPGTVLSQTPKAGETAEKQSEVTILVAVGTGKVDVPNLVGQTPPEAEKTLRKAGLSLGQATPQPVDVKAKISSQIPAAKEIVQEGKPIDIFLEVPGAGGAKNGAGGAAAGGGGDGGGGGGGDEGGPVSVPAIDGAQSDAYGQKAGDEGLVPVLVTAFDESEKGTVFRVDPEPGTEVEAGTKVKVFVSAGFPELAYDDDRDILRANGADGKTLEPIAKGSQDEHDPAWSADGSAIIYTSDGQVFLRKLTGPDQPAQELTAKGEKFSDLAWAPTGRVNAIAMAKEANDATDLCLARIGADGMSAPACKTEPDFSIQRKINWEPDGKGLLAWGFRTGTQKFGIVRWTTKKPFSTDPDDWSAGKFETDVTTPGVGVLDAAISPDGKKLAIINLGKNGRPELFLTKPGDFLLQQAKPLHAIACKVIWRPDGEQLVIVRSDNCFTAATGELIRLPLDDPSAQRSLKLSGDNPVFQPLAAG
jgi:beta-lactam-binding protein with PASTA domain